MNKKIVTSCSKKLNKPNFCLKTLPPSEGKIGFWQNIEVRKKVFFSFVFVCFSLCFYQKISLMIIALFVARKYFLSKKKNLFINIISFITVL
ncbi:MAG: hypothetical protein ACK40K_02000, partial [Raineya sp.]